MTIRHDSLARSPFDLNFRAVWDLHLMPFWLHLNHLFCVWDAFGWQIGTKGGHWDSQNELNNEVCKMRLDFGENVPPQGGPGDPQGGLMGPQMSPRRAPGRPETAQMRVQEAQSAPKKTYRRSISISTTPKSLNRSSRHPFLHFPASMFIKKPWKNKGFLKCELFQCLLVLDVHFGAFWMHLEAFWGVREAFGEPKWIQKWPKRHPK